jgi:hypothetical protein
VAEDEAGRGSGATANHVLVTAADVGGEGLEDNAVVRLATAGLYQLGVGDGGDFDFAGADVDDASVAAAALGVEVTVALVEGAGGVSAGWAVNVAVGAAGGGGGGEGGGGCVEGAGVGGLADALMLLGGGLRRVRLQLSE